MLVRARVTIVEALAFTKAALRSVKAAYRATSSASLLSKPHTSRSTTTDSILTHRHITATSFGEGRVARPPVEHPQSPGSASLVSNLQ